MYQEF